VVVTLGVVAAAAVGVLAIAHAGHEEVAMRVAPSGVVELAGLPEHVASQYRFAAAHPDIFREVPCFCGCDAALEHRVLLDCFVRPADGRWEAHAAGCAVCLREGEVVRQMLAGGATADQIRSEVIGRYGPMAGSA
jgi:hypothetical protein